MLLSRNALSHVNLLCLVLTVSAIAAAATSAATSAAASSPVNMLTAPITTRPGCPRKCGNLTVPYPFGIGGVGGKDVHHPCYIHPLYRINCDHTSHPPKAYLHYLNLEVTDISESHLRVKTVVLKLCNGIFKHNQLELSDRYTFSASLNSFMVIGCNYFSVINGTIGMDFPSACYSVCYDDYLKIRAGSCSGLGCCRATIPKGLNQFDIIFYSSLFPLDQSCGYAFLGETDRFSFRGQADLVDPNFFSRVVDHVPVVLDWDVGYRTKCKVARKDAATYACKGNTHCTDSDNMTASRGYLCSCLPGYEGNPYLTPGCTDIQECRAGLHNCSSICTNTDGSYKCSCLKRHHGDGFKNGTGCVPFNYSELALKSGLGTSSALLFVFFCITMVCLTIRSRRSTRMREKFFEQNGGLLLMQQLASNQSGMESTKIFTSKELKLATNNYNEDRILGTGGYGTVYKGILPNNCVVAIKKSKVADQSQIEQFINEMVILTRINHRNVVKLLGCCLEEEVPLLVYEFISNGTLFEHIHKKTMWLTWPTCIRIASEAANALAYLHASVSIPIIHRDVKTTNILIDETYTTKISDFGASRLIPLDQTRVTTLVLGTLGYLDPEYFHTSQLTEKSDVYSFGVVLAELLTREKPLSNIKRSEDRNLASHLVLAIKEDRLFEIIHPQLIKEANEEQLVSFAKLGQMCLGMKGDIRPTMKEVSLKLEELKKNI